MIGAGVIEVGIEGSGQKHPLGVVEGATENAATVQALLDTLIDHRQKGKRDQIKDAV